MHALTAQSDKDLLPLAVEFLRLQGYLVLPPGAHVKGWMTPAQFAAEFDVSKQHLSGCFRHPDAPEVVQDLGPTGRVKRFRPTQDFIAFALRNKQS